ncbi:transglutaminase domain-containing protein, partial [Paenibacillus sp. MCAF20]
YDNLIDSSNTEQGKLYSLDLKTKETKSVFGRTYFSGYNQAIIADKYGSDYSFINSKLADTYKKAKEIVQSTITSDMPEREKIRAVHDYVVLNAAYDYDNYKRGTIPDDSYSEYGILMLKTGVCEGYALTMQLLFNLAGIESYYLAGTANGGGHAWNVVKLDGKYYHLDATWDDPVPDRPGKTRYAYFLISDEQMAQDHKWDMESLNRLLGR